MHLSEKCRVSFRNGVRVVFRPPGSHAIHIVAHRLRTPVEEIAFTSRLKINYHSQIFRCGRSIFCLPHRSKFSDFFDLCFHWVSVVRVPDNQLSVAFLRNSTVSSKSCLTYSTHSNIPCRPSMMC